MVIRNEFLLCVFVQMVLKVHNVDGSTKMVAIHETMNAKDVTWVRIDMMSFWQLRSGKGSLCCR